MNEMKKKKKKKITPEGYRQKSKEKHEYNIDHPDQIVGGWCTHSLSVYSIPSGQLIHWC